MKWLQLGILAEIVDRSGTVRQTAGCSIVGRREFAQRLEQIQEVLGEQEGGVVWYDLYGADLRFTHLLDRCMMLNGLDADWFTPSQIEALLFPHLGEGGEPQQGHLIAINAGTTDQSDRQTSQAPQTMGEVIACLSEDLEQAMAIATEVPADLAIAINQAQAAMRLADDERAELERKKSRPDPKEIEKLLLGGS
jgi:hypothetical protein